MSPTVRTIVFGFLAGAISVVVFHQTMVLVLHLVGQVPNFPWSFRPNAWGVPTLINQMFWGGLWGVAFAYVAGRIPLAAKWAKGLILGLVGPFLIGNLIVLPLIRGQALFAGGVPMRLLVGGLIGAAFGIGWAYLHAFLRKRLG